MILAGVTAMALLVLWATQFSAFVWLLIFFLLASLGASSSAPGGSKAIAAWFPRSQRGHGVRQTGVMIGGRLRRRLQLWGVFRPDRDRVRDRAGGSLGGVLADLAPLFLTRRGQWPSGGPL